MDIKDIQTKARFLGINPDGQNKIELIHSIQRAEGFSPCYGYGMFTCDNLNCCWRQDCCGLMMPIVIEVEE